MSNEESKPLSEETKQLIVDGYRKTNQKLGFDPAHEAEKQELKEKIEDLTEQLTISNYEKQKSKAEHDGYPAPAPKGNPLETAPLNEFYQEKPSKQSNTDDWQTRTYDSEADCIKEISKRAKAGDKDAQRYEAQIYKKNFSGNWEYAFDFDPNDGFGSKALYKKTIPVKAGMSPEEKEAAQEYNRKLRKAQSNWKKIE